MFTEYSHLDLNKIAQTISKVWEEQNTFERSISSLEDKENYVFYEGPPSANGMPGIHHVMARTLKDIFCRYHTLLGKKVERKAGWDTHGLPVELGVEKELGITKQDIGKKISIKDYNEACKQAVLKYTKEWNDLTTKMGYWVDMENPYITYEPKYMETIWWLIKEIYKKNLLYKGYTIQPYSPMAGTGISSHELNMPGCYKDVTDTSIVAQFLVDKSSTSLFSEIDGEVFILAWTTTPWTLPSNTALTVGAKIEYVLVETENVYTQQKSKVVLAKALVNKQFTKYQEILPDQEPEDGKIGYKIVKSFLGKELENTKYEQLLQWALPANDSEKAFRVICDDFVTTEDGTGVVHTAPTFGEDDARVAKENNVPPMLVDDGEGNMIPLVNMQGKFLASLPEIAADKFVKNEYYAEGEAPDKSMDVEISILLKEMNRAFNVEKYKHSYPHCWRTDKPILYYPLDSWFIKVSDKKQQLIDSNKEINWKPKSTGSGRFGNWLENANDWNLSRSRYWGTPLPIWVTEDGKQLKVIGSVEELIKEIKISIQNGFMEFNPFEDFLLGDHSEENYAKIDLHKNIVDEIFLTSETGEKMFREKDLIDVWFDSGAMPFAQWHYPFEHKNLIDEGTYFPADFIAEGVDQTRGWFYTLHVISNLVFGTKAYKNVISNGLVLDKNGQKMSKRLGNSVEPNTTIAQYGPDPLRWYMISNALPWDNLKFDLNGVDEVRKKFFGTLYNTYSFFALYANIDKFDIHLEELDAKYLSELDRWILSELNSLVKEVNAAYADYEPTKAARLLSEFVQDNLSNWYIRLSRRIFWKGEYTNEKIATYQSLYKCLLTTSQLMSPIAPFYADQLYRDLMGISNENDASVHLTTFPKANLGLIDEKLQEKMRLAQKITSLALSIRKKEKIKVRQPLSKIIIPTNSEETKSNIMDISKLLKQEVNVKEIEVLDSVKSNELLVKKVKPNFKLLGPKFGKEMKLAAQKITQFTNEEINLLEEGNSIEVQIADKIYEVLPTELDIITQDIPGWSIASHGKLTVAIDLELSDELILEGYARELVNKIQGIRKDIGLEVTDRIKITLTSKEILTDSINKNKQYICNETLADDIYIRNEIENGTEIEINDQNIQIRIEK